MILFCLEKQLPRDYIKLTCDPAVKLLKYLNLTMKFNYATVKWFIPKLIRHFKEKGMERKNRILQDIANNILGCLKEKYSQVFLPAASSIKIWLFLFDNKEKKREDNSIWKN